MEAVFAKRTTENDIQNYIPKNVAQLFIDHIHDPGSVLYTFVTRTETIALCGIVGVVLTSMGEAWMYPLEGFFKHPMAVFSIRDNLRESEKSLGYQRYQICTKVSEPKHTRFAEWLGYEKEGVLRSYRNGEDFFILSRIYRGTV